MKKRVLSMAMATVMAARAWVATGQRKSGGSP